MRKTARIISLLLVLLLLLAGCGGTENPPSSSAAAPSGSSAGGSATTAPSQGEQSGILTEEQVGKKKVAMLVKNQLGFFWIEVAEYAKVKAEEYGWDIEILSPIASDNNEEQIQLLENALINPPDIFIIAPSDSAGIAPAIEAINKAGVPIINLNTRIFGDNIEYVTYISVENYNMGHDLITNAINAIGETGKAVIIEGKTGSQTYMDRDKGGRDAFAEHAGWEIIDSQVANGNRAEALSVTQNLLTKHPEIDMIYSQSGEMALGVIEAITQAGRKEISVVCVNAFPEICDAISEGRILMAMDDAGYVQGPISLEYAMKYFQGYEMEKDVWMEAIFVDKNNVQEYHDRYKEEYGQ